MFESNNQQLNQDNNLSSDYQVANIPDDSMSYMPDKFLKPDMTPKGNGLFFKIGISLLVLAVISVGGFALYIFKFRNTDTTQNNQKQEDVLDLAKNEDTRATTTDALNLDTQEGRDQKRLQDISDLVSALSIYFNKNDAYPQSLSDLSGTISEMPVDPTPSNEGYNYTLNPDKKDYKLTFVLENESKFRNIIYQSGKYQISSSGIIMPYKDNATDSNNQEDDTADQNNNDNGGYLPVPPKGPDTDKDELTNLEEFIFGTQIDKSDTDDDTYKDGDEIGNLYDPTSKTGKLADNINIVKVFNNEYQNYSILYPAKWVEEDRSSDLKEIVFYDDKNGDFFKIQVNDNPQGLNLKSWYLSVSPGMNPNDLQEFKGKNLTGIITNDGLNIYYAKDDKVYLVSYIVKSEVELNYYTTFLMFVRSFRPIIR